MHFTPLITNFHLNEVIVALKAIGSTSQRHSISVNGGGSEIVCLFLKFFGILSPTMQLTLPFDSLVIRDRVKTSMMVRDGVFQFQ